MVTFEYVVGRLSNVMYVWSSSPILWSLCACFHALVLVSCSSTEVANSDYAAVGSVGGVQGETVAVQCDTGYSGGGNTTCTVLGFEAVACTGKRPVY